MTGSNTSIVVDWDQFPRLTPPCYREEDRVAIIALEGRDGGPANRGAQNPAASSRRVFLFN